MQAQIGKWGNSLAVRIPGAYARELGLREGSDLDVALVNGGLLRPRAHTNTPSTNSSPASLRRICMAKRIGGRPAVARPGSTAYVPDAGDLVWFSFSPQAGRKQAGRRPALVLSRRAYNVKTGLCLVCPITSHAKGFPFEVLLPDGLPVAGVVLSDHVKNNDWRDRRAVSEKGTFMILIG